MYKLGGLMYGCLNGQSPRYLVNYCTPVSDVQQDNIFAPPAAVLSYHRVIDSAFMPSGFFCGWPDGLELSPGQSMLLLPDHWQRQLQPRSENVFAFDILAH